MLNINEIMSALVRIRDAIDKVEVKGQANRSLLVFAYEDCNQLLTQLGDILEKAKQDAEISDGKPILKEVTSDAANENA